MKNTFNQFITYFAQFESLNEATRDNESIDIVTKTGLVRTRKVYGRLNGYDQAREYETNKFPGVMIKLIEARGWTKIYVDLREVRIDKNGNDIQSTEFMSTSTDINKTEVSLVVSIFEDPKFQSLLKEYQKKSYNSTSKY